jgi:transaldolase
MLFLDTANPHEVSKYQAWGVCRGVTTNQKIMLNSGVKYTPEAYRENIETICGLMRCGDPVSVELTNTAGSVPELVKEAMDLYDIDRSHIVIKVPMWGSGKGLEVIRQLRVCDIPTNATCLMSAIQGILASEAGARYISLFYNRMVDKIGVARTVEEFNYLRRYVKENTQIIAGSIRNPADVLNCFNMGAHIVTVPPNILEQLPGNPATEATIAEFDKSWRDWVAG